jgi:4-aminobutyrate aminotransferase/(S)-3-amino-2-methylpropionate transaminase
MLGLEFVREGDGSPDAELASRIVGESLNRGLILLKAGIGGNVIRTLVPLVISDAELDEALAVFNVAVASATAAVTA